MKTKEGVPVFREYATGYAQYATGEEWRNSSRKNEEAEPKWKQYPTMYVTSDGSKVWCCKEQYYNIAQEPGMLGLWSR